MMQVIPWESYTWRSHAASVRANIQQIEQRLAQERRRLARAERELAEAETRGAADEALPSDYGVRLIGELA